ncbi:hydrolase, hydrolyzing O-glycosyl compounds, putative [Ricinus communis]|uniref:glucan endo-1,3-beta-D-glucosidase n=1 Tax=Ricinus communis TaxID=3988 RepID=B9R9A4_RICCO|nr:hydrolase, hydrolyzing O-glycosyl compounds, putative [Ricinus communis]
MDLYLLSLVIYVSSCFFYIHAGAQEIGVNYGLLGNNLPPPDSVINLLKSRNIQKGTPASIFRYISAGNEVILGPLAHFVIGAMKNLDTALKAANLHIPVSTAIHFQAIGQSFPPSNGAFSEVSVNILTPIIAFLESREFPLLVNVYPYFAYIGLGDPKSMKLEYALGNAGGGVVSDGVLQYNNLFDAIIDTVYSAIEKVGGKSVRVVVLETGWPTAENGEITTVGNAQAYVNNVIARIKSQSGTPKRPRSTTEMYIFALFNENLKPPGTEQNFGLYQPDMTEEFIMINLLKSRNIQKVRIFDPNPGVLRALGDTGMEVVIGVRNKDLEQLAANSSSAIQWVHTNVVPYVPAAIFRYISAGNEVILGPLAHFVIGAMKNLDTALKAANLHIPVSTAIHFQAIGQSFPPSNGAFSEVSVNILTPIITFHFYFLKYKSKVTRSGIEKKSNFLLPYSSGHNEFISRICVQAQIKIDPFQVVGFFSLLCWSFERFPVLSGKEKNTNARTQGEAKFLTMNQFA